MRAAKSDANNKIAITRCLASCLLHWDLVSAQQITAIISRSFPQDRNGLFWNIAVMHLLAMSSQALPDQRRLYGTLARKQIERAAQLAEQAHTDSKSPSGRLVRTEQEILLLYDIVGTHGSVVDLQRLLDSPVFSPLAQLKLGRRQLLQRVAACLHQAQDWTTLYSLCHSCLSLTDENGNPDLQAADWLVWKMYLDVAERLRCTKPGYVDCICKDPFLTACVASSKVYIVCY